MLIIAQRDRKYIVLPLIVIISIICQSVVQPALAQQSTYKRGLPGISLDYDPSGLAVNNNTNMVYVIQQDRLHLGDGYFSIINGKTNTTIDTIRLAHYPTHIAVNPNTNAIYVVNPLNNDTV